MDLNFLSLVHLTKVVLPYMTHRRKGHIVVTGSIGAIVGVPLSASYSASKFALRVGLKVQDCDGPSLQSHLIL